MTGFLDWLPDVLRRAGVDVYVMPGAERRTTRSDGLAVRGIVWHHTATGLNWKDGHVAALLRDGRTDLAGPLAQVGIERDGTWVIVALGRANHNGFGTWGNDSLGLEFYNSGVGEPWPDVQVRSGVVGTAAVLAYLGKPISAVLGHRETDPRRKVDPAGLDMTSVRRQVDAAMRHPEEEIDMTPEQAATLARIDAVIGNNIPPMRAVLDSLYHAGTVDDIEQVRAMVEAVASRDPQAVVAAIPDDLAQQVLDALAERLKD